MASDSQSKSGGGCLGCGALLLFALLGAGSWIVLPGRDWNQALSEMVKGARQAMAELPVDPAVTDPVHAPTDQGSDSGQSGRKRGDAADQRQTTAPEAPRRLSVDTFVATPVGGTLEFDCPKCGRVLRWAKPKLDASWTCCYFDCPDHCRRPVVAFERLANGTWRELPVRDCLDVRGSLQGGLVKLDCPQCGKVEWAYISTEPQGLCIPCRNTSCRHLLLYCGVDETGHRRAMPDYFEGINRNAKLADYVEIWKVQVAGFRYNHLKVTSGNRTWQTAGETWKTGTGVCRDSATLLADWLCAAGYDARIAVGSVRGPGPGGGGLHAWVAVIDKATGKQYVLESTYEYLNPRMRVPPLAELATEYYPEFQFLPGRYMGRDISGWTGDYVNGWYFTTNISRN